VLGATVATARPPAAPLPDRAEWLDRWSRLHGGYDLGASAVAGRWLAVIWTLSRPLARRGVAPAAVTGWAVLVGLAVPAAAALGGRWPVLAAALVVGSGVLDGVDGAVAVLSRRDTRFGSVLDSLADRVSDSAYVLALWVLGAPGWLCLAGGGVAVLQEYARARAGVAGMTEIGVVTVAERPTRVIVAALALLGCGVCAGSADSVASAGAAVWTVLGVVGLVQLLVVVRRRLG
jgi:phosphatidylglycerophosphate synthase